MKIKVSPINLNKETNPLTLEVVSQSNSLSKLKTSSQIENEVLLTNQTLNIKIKAKSCHRPISSKSSSKSPSELSSTSRDTYLLILERRKTVEQANLLARQAEERSKRKLKFLEKSYEPEKEKQFKNSLLLYDDLKDKKLLFADSNFKSSENNGVRKQWQRRKAPS